VGIVLPTQALSSFSAKPGIQTVRRRNCGDFPPKRAIAWIPACGENDGSFVASNLAMTKHYNFQLKPTLHIGIDAIYA